MAGATALKAADISALAGRVTSAEPAGRFNTQTQKSQARSLSCRRPGASD